MNDRFQKKNIDIINLHITSYCDRKCQYCCCDIPKSVNKKHYDLKYFENLDEYFKNMHIKITGGEPTFHPHFEEITKYIKKKLNPIKYELATNGYGFDKLSIESFEIFDEIYVTEYDKPSNVDKISYLENKINNNKTKFNIWKNVIHIEKSKGSNPCYRGSNGMASYDDGLLYPCCVSAFNKKIGIKLNENWKENILKVELPCDGCVFGEK